LGDGVALLRLLLEKVSDQETEILSGQNIGQEKPMGPAKSTSNMLELLKKKFHGIFNIYTWIMITHIIKAPSVIWRLNAREIDGNSIHPRQLCGKKVCQ
jgi:hypothetical protein